MEAVLAFSGGLDTSFCVARLTRERGAEVTTVTVNTGGASRADLDAVAAQARALGAVEHHEVDARDAVFDRFIAMLIRGSVLRGAVYPVSVAAERTQQALKVAQMALLLGADAVAHGSTGAGNLALGVLTARAARERRALRRRQAAFDRALEALAGGGKR